MCSAGNRQHCVVQETGSIVYCRRQAALCSVEDRLVNYAHVQSLQVQVYKFISHSIAALCSAGDRRRCVVQRQEQGTFCTEHEQCAAHRTEIIVLCRGQASHLPYVHITIYKHRTRSIVQCRGKGELCSTGQGPQCSL